MDVAKNVWARQRMRATSMEFDDQLFSKWRTLLESRAGLYIAPERRSFLASGLRGRMRETGCKDYREYYEFLVDGAVRAEEWSLLIDVLTVHETCFFRHDSSMRLVSDLVLPDVFGRRESFNAWSVGCATGEEVYSLAMLMDDYCAKTGKPRLFGVTGTDISLPALRHARAGAYVSRRLRNIKTQFREKYCAPVSSRHFQIDDSIRQRVCFALLNLRDISKSPFRGFDLIFCQNLMIYFDREQRHEIASNLAERLRPGGFLILGPGELLRWQNPLMEKMHYDDTLAYRRTASLSEMQQEGN